MEGPVAISEPLASNEDVTGHELRVSPFLPRVEGKDPTRNPVGYRVQLSLRR